MNSILQSLSGTCIFSSSHISFFGIFAAGLAIFLTMQYSLDGAIGMALLFFIFVIILSAQSCRLKIITEKQACVMVYAQSANIVLILLITLWMLNFVVNPQHKHVFIYMECLKNINDGSSTTPTDCIKEPRQAGGILFGIYLFLFLANLPGIVILVKYWRLLIRAENENNVERSIEESRAGPVHQNGHY